MRVDWIILPAALAASTSAYAAVYLTLPQAQAALFPGAALTAAPVKLSPEQRRAIEKASGVHVRNAELRSWRANTGGWFIVDDVLGKHEFITFALALSGEGAVRGLEILEYRETYGGQIRDPKWRAQFAGKTATAPLTLDRDIKNITGATLSCRHVTDGVKRLLATYEIVLKSRP